MKFIVTIILCFQFIVLLADANVNVGTTRNWIEFNKSVNQNISKNISDYKNIKISTNDTEEECYKKLLQYGAYFWKNPSGETHDNLLNLYREAMNLHPSSVMLKVSYLPYFHNKDIEKNALYCIKNLSFLLENNNPYVIESLVYILNSLRRNACMDQESSPLVYQNIYEALGCPHDYFAAKERLTLLTQFWRSKLPYGIKDSNFDNGIKQAVLEMSNKKTENQALSYWSIVLYNIGVQDAKQQEFIKIQERNELNAKMIIANNKKQEDADQIKFQNALNEFNVFLKVPNDMMKIELTLNQVTIHRRKFKKEYPNIPNYDDLKKTIGNYEANIINIAYKAYILRDYKDCLELLNQIDSKVSDSDIRALTIKIYCMQKEKLSSIDIIKTIDHLLNIDPQNQRAFMLKRMLEAQEELKQKSINK